MAVTAKQVYDMALVLMDEVEDNGIITVDNPQEYEAKALSILNTLQFEFMPPAQSPVILTNLSQNMTVSDRISYLVLPYGLAAHILFMDGSENASFFNARYDELKRKLPTAITPITDVYQTFGGMQ